MEATKIMKYSGKTKKQRKIDEWTLLEEGLKEGRKVQALETADKLKALGMDVETIQQVTGLTPEELIG